MIERTYGERDHEFSDVLAWVASLANQVGVDLTTVVDRFKDGCPTWLRPAVQLLSNGGRR